MLVREKNMKIAIVHIADGNFHTVFINVLFYECFIISFQILSFCVKKAAVKRSVIKIDQYIVAVFL